MLERFGRIYVAGHRGMVGSAIVRKLEALGVAPPIVRTREELDLTDRIAVRKFFHEVRPDLVFLAAARVGGILANFQYGWDFLYENLLIETSVLGSALETEVARVVFLGSSCIYPRMAPQPIQESALLTGPLERTNEAYALAKIAGVKLVDAAAAQFGAQWVSLMPSNLYGPRDNFDLETSHVLPAMIRKFHDGKIALSLGDASPVVLWGTGNVRREFLYVDDLANAAVAIADDATLGLINVGYGSDIVVRDLAQVVARIVGYSGETVWDTSKPDGTPQKLLDSARMFRTGWSPSTTLEEGIALTYRWFCERAA